MLEIGKTKRVPCLRLLQNVGETEETVLWCCKKSYPRHKGSTGEDQPYTLEKLRGELKLEPTQGERVTYVGQELLGTKH